MFDPMNPAPPVTTNVRPLLIAGTLGERFVGRKRLPRPRARSVAQLCVRRALLRYLLVAAPRPSAFLAVVVLVATASSAVPATVPIWVTSPGAPIAFPTPLRLGVPFPKGLLAPGDRFDLDVGDARAAVQTTPLEYWPDGSVRWLLADVVLPAVPTGRTVAMLGNTTAEPKAAPRIAASPGAPTRLRSSLLSLDVAPTGSVTVTLLGTPAPPIVLDPIAVDTGQDGPSTVTAVRVARSGPVRAEVVIEQTHPGGLTTDTHVIAWAGATTLLVRERIVNRTGMPRTPLRAARLGIRVPGVERAAAMVDGAPHAVDVGPSATRLAQLEPTTATSNGAAAGTHLDGAVAVRSATLALTAVVPDCWQQYPKAFTISTGGLAIDLVAGGDAPVALGIGAAKTHDVWLHLAPASDAPPLPALAHAFQDPPRALAAPDWTRASGALPGIIDPAQPAAKAFLAHLRADALRYDSRGRHERWDEGPPGPCSARTSAHPHTGYFGVLNWGDWNFPGYRDEVKECDGWGNLEYDLPWVFGLAWASTGDPIWAGWFDRAVSHYRDVDVIHAFPEHPEWVGLNHPHKVGHFDTRARAKIDLGHVWLGGLLLQDRLEGNEASRDAMLAMAHRLSDLVDRMRTPRQYGWPIIALAAAAEATGDPALRDAALRDGHLGMARFPPDHTASDWKIGILASGLAALHRLTGDDAARDWLLRYGAGLLADQHLADLDPRYVAVSGYLATLTKDPRYAALATRVATAMTIGTWGKPLAMHGRVGFELLAFPLPDAAPAVTPGPGAPPAASDPAPR
jgi:hypothetical protein